jgi:hypothetical protein
MNFLRWLQKSRDATEFIAGREWLLLGESGHNRIPGQPVELHPNLIQ